MYSLIFFQNTLFFLFNLDEFSLLFFDHTETSQFTGGGMQILTYIWHSWQLFAACQTYYDTGHPFLRSSPRTRDTHACHQVLAVELSLPVLTT